jgi:two-component system LytT family response regulator
MPLSEAGKQRIRAWLVDDEELGLKRLARLLSDTGRVEIIGTNTDPEEAVAALNENEVDVLFLDIEMPGLNGFELLARLENKPQVVFTTAYDQYAVKAFEANGTDYLLKPVSPEALDRALAKLERNQGSKGTDYNEMLAQLTRMLEQSRRGGYSYPRRLPSKIGDRVLFVDIDQVTHFYAEGKLTYAATPAKNYVIDDTIAQLESKLDPAQFQRIHRSYLVNLSAVAEIGAWFGGKMIARLNDATRTELPIAKDRVRTLKERLGF